MTAIAVATIVAASAAADSSLCWEGEEMKMKMLNELRPEYERMFSTCVVRPERKREVERVITRIMKERDRYEQVSQATGVPFFIIGIIHNLECGGRFDCHLHNGDPLNKQTVQVPAGRPAKWDPPGTWEQSAVDALMYDGFDAWTDWSIGGTLFKIEAYNGLGYRAKRMPSPYLWSTSQHYTKGKYVRDGVFDPNAVSNQIGAAVLLRRMVDQHLIDFGGTDAPGPVVRVTATSLNVRSQPSATAPIVTQLDEDATVLKIALNPDGSWTNVRLASGQSGWVASRYVISQEKA